MVDYIQNSSSAEQPEKSRRRWFYRSVSVVVTLAAVVAAGASSYARPRQRTAEQAPATHDMSEAIRLAEAHRPCEALAYLARSVRMDPRNVVGRSLLLDILLHRNWPLPLVEMRHASAGACAEISPDGDRVLTTSRDGTARLWDARTGEPIGGLRIGFALNFCLMLGIYMPVYFSLIFTGHQLVVMMLSVVAFATLSLLFVERNRTAKYVATTLGLTATEASKILSTPSWRTSVWQRGPAAALLRRDATRRMPDRASSDTTLTALTEPPADRTDAVTRL